MRATFVLVILGLLLMPLGCAAPVGGISTSAAKGPTGLRSPAATPAPDASGAPRPTSRPAVPDWAAPYQKKLVVGVITKEPAVALTIDDVGAQEMKSLVDALVANDLHATLLCSGSQMTTAAAAYAAANGIELANHSWNHTSIGWYRPQAANEQIMNTARLLKAGSGEWPLWYRAPFQLYQSQGMRAVAGAGMLAAGVSNDPLDYRGNTGAKLVSHVSRRLKPGQIILLHHYPQTIATFPALATELRRRGYRTMTLSELAQTGDPATSNWQLEPFARFFGH